TEKQIAPLDDGIEDLEKQAEQARARLAETIARCEDARAAVARHTIELRDAFAASVRALLQGKTLRDLVELNVDVPSTVLPAGVSLLDAPGLASESVWDRNWARALLRDADGCIVAGGRLAKADARTA